jgi:hypothetical protein
MTRSRPLPAVPHRPFFPSWWTSAARGAAPGPRWTRLALEVLEDRLAPAGVVAHYDIAPVGPVNPGQMFSLQVTPVDANNNLGPTGLGSVSFTSSDLEAYLPGPFNISTAPTETGTYTIPGFTLNTSGRQTITLKDSVNHLSATIPVDVNLLPPTGLELSINVPNETYYSSPSVVFNQQFTLSGGFMDTANIPHTVKIDWGAGPDTTINLPAGVFSFSTNHAYGSETGIADFSGQNEPITVTVSNSAGSTSAGTSIFVQNLSPQVYVTPSAFGNVGTAYTASGSFDASEEGASYTVLVNYGDGTGTHTVPYDSTNDTFNLQHTYTKDGSYKVTVTVKQSDGEFGTTSFFAHIFLPGVADVKQVTIAPGETQSLTVGGATVTLTHSIASTEDATLLVALVPVSSEPDLANSSYLDNSSLLVTAFDVRVINGSLLDKATITFAYTADNNDDPRFTFFNSGANRQQAINQDQYTVDYYDDTIHTFLNEFTTPSVDDVTGTVFTIAVPVAVTPSPSTTPTSTATTTPSASPTSSTSTSSSTSTASGSSSSGSQEPLAELSRQSPASSPDSIAGGVTAGGGGSGRSTGAVTGDLALAFAEGVSGGGDELIGAAAGDGGPLRELPAVTAPLIGAPSAVISPPRVSPPPEPGGPISMRQEDKESEPLRPERTEVAVAVSVAREDEPPVEDNLVNEVKPAEEAPALVSDAIFARLMQPRKQTSWTNKGQLLLVATALHVASLQGKRKKEKGKREEEESRLLSF